MGWFVTITCRRGFGHDYDFPAESSSAASSVLFLADDCFDSFDQ